MKYILPTTLTILLSICGVTFSTFAQESAETLSVVEKTEPAGMTATQQNEYTQRLELKKSMTQSRENAQMNTSSSPSSETMTRKMIQNQKENIRAESMRKIGTTSTKIPAHEEHAERIVAHGEKMTARLNAAITRLEKIAARLDSRISKIEATGITLTSAKNMLTTAQADLKSARASMTTLPTTFIEIEKNSKNPKEAFMRMKVVLKTEEASVKSAHKTLVEAITLVKASDPTSATSTLKKVIDPSNTSSR